MLCFISDVLVSLEQTFYAVNESSGTLEICVVAPGLSRSINITVLPINGSAQGRVRSTAGNLYGIINEKKPV